jgi:hypothetical protein
MMTIVVLPHGTFEALKKEKKKNNKILIPMGITEWRRQKNYKQKVLE